MEVYWLGKEKKDKLIYEGFYLIVLFIYFFGMNLYVN